MSTQTVFVLFRYCPLCRLNHKKGKNHVFSQKHKDIVANILVKFSKKITEAKEFLKKPSVKDLTWDQADNKFWCYFCQEDICKHRLSMSVFGQCVVEYGGFLEHITRNDHTENTAKFLKENKLDMTRTSEFIINTTVYLKYLEDVESASSQFFTQKSQILTQVASQIRSQSVIRHNVVTNSLREQSLQQQNRQQQQRPCTLGVETRRPKPVRGPVGIEEGGKKTIQACGEGLTTIERHNEDDSVGNIYTNAVPPWIQPDQDTAPSTGVVGPTMEDLEKHKKLERKRQLPACRVGAKFDHRSSETESWLPYFGGVWNHGRRTKSVHQFIKRQKRGVSSHSSSTQLGSSDQKSASSVQTSYSFPKIPMRTATVTSNSDILTNGIHDQSVDKSDAVVTHSGSVFPLNAVSVSQNADFCYRQDSEKSTFASFTSSAGTSSLTGNALQQVSDLVDADSSVTVKPYVKKRRTAPSTLSEQNRPALPAYLPQNPDYYPARVATLSEQNRLARVATVNTRNSMSEAHPYPALNTKMPFENHLPSSGHDGVWHNNGMAYIRRPNQDNHSYVSVSEQDIKTGSFRLLATPVLSQQKSKLPVKKIFGTGRSGK